jgi:hypothetical protein
LGGGEHGAREILPRGHPWRLSHGGDVAAILRPAPRVRRRGTGEKGAIPLDEHLRPELGRPHGSACVPVAAPRAPAGCDACIGVYSRRRKKGKQRLADVWTPPGGENKGERCKLGLARLRNWTAC